MKWTREDVQRVRDISIAVTMGVTNGRRTNIVCPMPDHRDRTASFLIDENNGFHCFGCNSHGNGFIDFITQIMVKEGYDENTIFKMIMDEYGSN